MIARTSAVLVVLLVLLALPLHAELTRFFTGNHSVDVTLRLHGPTLILAGGGGDQTEAMQAAVNSIRGCDSREAKVDVVVIRASGGPGYNGYLQALDGANWVVTPVITDRDSASRPDVVDIVRMAELVFFAGGDQCNYIRWIKGAPVEQAVESLYRRGGAIGGTSAGLAIMGEVSYDACPSQSAQSAQVLMDLFHVDVSVSRNFFHWPLMIDTSAELHAPLRHVVDAISLAQRSRHRRFCLKFFIRPEQARRSGEIVRSALGHHVDLHARPRPSALGEGSAFARRGLSSYVVTILHSHPS